MSKRDCVHIPYHRNIGMVLSTENYKPIFGRVDLRQLPDFEKRWEDHVLEPIVTTPLIFMKHYRQTLTWYIKKRKEMNFLFSGVEIGYILRGILRGINHLHEHKIVHRDLHPENVFVEASDGRVWVGDFGCCLDLKDRENFLVKCSEISNISLSTSLDIGGLIGFLPPEISRAMEDRNDETIINYEKCDVYSAGLIGKELMKDIMEELEEDDEGNELVSFIEGICREEFDERIGVKDAVVVIDVIMGVMEEED